MQNISKKAEDETRSEATPKEVKVMSTSLEESVKIPHSISHSPLPPPYFVIAMLVLFVLLLCCYLLSVYLKVF